MLGSFIVTEIYFDSLSYISLGFTVASNFSVAIASFLNKTFFVGNGGLKPPSTVNFQNLAPLATYWSIWEVRCILYLFYPTAPLRRSRLCIFTFTCARIPAIIVLKDAYSTIDYINSLLYLRGVVHILVRYEFLKYLNEPVLGLHMATFSFHQEDNKNPRHFSLI